MIFLLTFRDEFDNFHQKRLHILVLSTVFVSFVHLVQSIVKGTPMHIKGGFVYNHMIKERNDYNKYPIIQDGDKIKYLELRQPNPLGCNVISFVYDKFQKNLTFTNTFDYDSQYEKSFIDPLSFITNNIGWKIDRSFGTQTTLEDFLHEF